MPRHKPEKNLNHVGYIKIYKRLRNRITVRFQFHNTSLALTPHTVLTYGYLQATLSSLFIPSATSVPCILNMHDMSSGRLNLVPLFL